jgi:hypothetical protein
MRSCGVVCVLLSRMTRKRNDYRCNVLVCRSLWHERSKSVSCRSIWNDPIWVTYFNARSGTVSRWNSSVEGIEVKLHWEDNQDIGENKMSQFEVTIHWPK